MQMQQLIDQLSTTYVERSETIEPLVAAVIARQPLPAQANQFLVRQALTVSRFCLHPEPQSSCEEIGGLGGRGTSWPLRWGGDGQIILAGNANVVG